MCLISINVDEAVLRDIRPELDNSEFIDVETMRENLHQMVREVYT